MMAQIVIDQTRVDVGAHCTRFSVLPSAGARWDWVHQA